MLRVLAAALLLPALATPQVSGRPLFRTPFGLYPRDCVQAVPSGSHILAAVGSDVRVLYPNGSEVLVAGSEGCALPTPMRPDRARGPSFWDGWPNHFWFGQGLYVATGDVIFSLNSSWRVPPFPRNTLGNGSDPYSTSPPTLSWWIGIQGPTVLQPVLEFNGLMPGVYDAASWNCCPAGMAWHSTPLPAAPGDLVVGGMIQVAGWNRSGAAALAGAGGPYTFVTETTVVSAGGRVTATSLTSDMAPEPGWNPTWAEAIFESWFATRCEHFPCGGYSLADVLLSVTRAGGPLNVTPVTPVPWAPFYEVENTTTPGSPVCGGATSVPADGSVDIAFNCAAPH